MSQTFWSSEPQTPHHHDTMPTQRCIMKHHPPHPLHHSTPPPHPTPFAPPMDPPTPAPPDGGRGAKTVCQFPSPQTLHYPQPLQQLALDGFTQDTRQPFKTVNVLVHLCSKVTIYTDFSEFLPPLQRFTPAFSSPPPSPSPSLPRPYSAWNLRKEKNENSQDSREGVGEGIGQGW